MKIAVIGAAGMVGSRVTAEALQRGHDVTTVSRNAAANVRADATDRERMTHLMSGMDGVVAATRPRPGHEAEVAETIGALLDAALTADVRMIVVGGAAPLRSPDGPGLVLDDARYVPTQFRSIAEASCTQFELCRHHPADWVYLSPPALLAPGRRTGAYRRGGDVLLTNAAGVSRISAEDLAVAVLDELENPHADHHFTVGY